MQVSNMSGRVLDWLMAAALPEANPNPATFQPTRRWEDVSPFWKRAGAGCCRTKKNKPTVVGTVGEGAYEATVLQYVARGKDPLEAICRVLVVAAFGTSVDVPKEYRS